MNHQRTLYSVASYQRKKGQSLTMNTKKIIIILMVSGEAHVRCNDQEWSLFQHSMLIIRPQDKLKIMGEQAKYIMITCDSYRLINKDAPLQYEENQSDFVRDPIFFQKIPVEYKTLVHEIMGIDEYLHTAELPLLLLNLISKAVAFYEKEERGDENFSEVLLYIEKYSHQTLTRDAVARHFGYHPNYFSELFKKETGWNFTSYVTHLRMDRAKIFLLDNSLTIGEVARKVGYQDGLYLSRKFREQTGVPPSEYRRSRDFDRIFTMQFTGVLLALGIEPKAVLSTYFNVPQLIESDVQHAMKLAPSWPIDEANWRALNPNIIIAPTYLYPRREHVERLEKIAPVIMLDWDKHNRLDEVRMLGKILNREEQAETWVEKFTKQAQEAKYLLQDVITPKATVGVYEVRMNDTIAIWRPTSRAASNIYDMLNLHAPEGIQKEVILTNKHKFINEDELENYVADHMFVIMPNEEKAKQVLAKPMWQKLMHKHKVYILRLQDFWAGEGVALEKQLNLQMSHLLGQIETDIYPY